MNKLEEYRDEMVLSYSVPEDDTDLYYSDGYEDGHKAGFDAAIALDLPVKFHIWTQEQEEPALAYLSDDDEWSVDLPHLERKLVSTKELYQYWIEHVYEPDI